MRREWIEIYQSLHGGKNRQSPSMRREWIEMESVRTRIRQHTMSPSMRREWIEIYTLKELINDKKVSLHAEGVD